MTEPCTRKEFNERLADGYRAHDPEMAAMVEAMQADLDAAHDAIARLAPLLGYEGGEVEGDKIIKQTLARLARWR